VTAVVGRDRELAEITSFLELAVAEPHILLLEGDAGIGKTTLWRAALDAAHTNGYRVLSCTATRSEAELSFTALRDLLGDGFDDLREGQRNPERRGRAVAVRLQRR
jgi:MoxR-like ATPase